MTNQLPFDPNYLAKRNLRPIAAYQCNGFTVAQSVVMDFGGGFVMDDFIMAKDLVAPSDENDSAA